MFKATLFVFDKEYDLIEHNISFDQEDDGDGMPNTRVSGGKLKMTYPSTKDDTEMRRVAFSNNTAIAGYIRIYKRDGFQKFYDYEFANAYVLFYKESFTANGTSPLLTKITISPGIVKRDDAIFENIWNPSNPFKNQNTPTVIKDKERVFKLLKGWWTSDSGGCNSITTANLGDLVYFHVETEEIEIGEQINCQLWEYDNFFGIDALNVDENKFPEHEINAKAIVQELNGEMVATTKLELQESWASMITDDNGDQLELYCNVSYKHLKKELPASRNDVLYVSHNNKTLYFKTPSPNHNLPEFISYDGDPMILMQFGKGFIGSKIKDKVLDIAAKKANKAIQNIVFAKLEKGYMSDNFGKVYKGKRLINEYKKIYSNSGELFEN